MAKTHNERLHSSTLATKYTENEKGKWVIAAPTEYDQVMRSVPEGMLITTEELKAALARKHQVDFACPMATGFFINMVAYASEERKSLGSPDITAYWRTLKKNGELNERYPGGIDAHKEMLEREGHTVVLKGKRHFVKDYKDKLQNDFVL